MFIYALIGPGQVIHFCSTLSLSLSLSFSLTCFDGLVKALLE